MNHSFSASDVLAWARTKPTAAEYDYMSDRCALGRFLVETGRASHPTLRYSAWDEGGPYNCFSDAIAEAACGKPHNFGSLVKRLESAEG